MKKPDGHQVTLFSVQINQIERAIMLIKSQHIGDLVTIVVCEERLNSGVK